MSIGIYNPYLDTMSGGERYMLTIALCLVKEHEVHLFWEPSEKEQIVAKAKKRFGYDLNSLVFKKNIFGQDVSSVQRLIKSSSYDYIFSLSDGSIPLLASSTILHFQSPVEWVEGKTFKNKIKLLRVKNIVCNSSFTKKYIDDKFGVKSQVLYPPVAIPQVSPLPKEKLILHVGRYGVTEGGSSYKKQEVLVKAFKEMVDFGLKDWELAFVMNVKERDLGKVEDFKKTIKNYPISIHINPENNSLWNLYQKSSFYWHASGYGEDLSKHPDRAEHFGISTVEAMGMGSVPLTFKAGGQTEIVGNGVNGYVWETTNELKDKTNELITDTKKREEMGKEAKLRAKKFGTEVFCDRLQELLK